MQLPLYMHNGANGKRSFRFLAKSSSSDVSLTANRFLCPAEAYTPRAMRTISPLSTILESIQFMVLRAVMPIADSQAQRSPKENDSFSAEYCSIRFLYVSIFLLECNLPANIIQKRQQTKLIAAFILITYVFLMFRKHFCHNHANAASIRLTASSFFLLMILA